MIQLEVMDSIMYEAQRQGRISFYMTNTGEEATHFGCANAIQPTDPVFAQYRETGILLARGYFVQQFLDQMFGNARDSGYGRQMPVHYGSREHHFFTISSPLGTQISQAVGSAYWNKIMGEERVPICFFGEGAASEGDCHAGFNFASTLKTPVLFFCRNNGYAISTPHCEQYAGDGIAARASGYGMPAFRVDGNDLWAVWEVTRKARALALKESTPVLIEAMTYRAGHHSTSDDSSAYRKLPDLQSLDHTCPLARVRRFMTLNRWWTDEHEKAARKSARSAILAAMKDAEKQSKPAIKHLFTDVYAEMPSNLCEQYQELQDHLAKYPKEYQIDSFAAK